MALLAESVREQQLLQQVERPRPISTSRLLAPQSTKKREFGEPLAAELQSVQSEPVSVVLPETARLLRQTTDTALGSGLMTARPSVSDQPAPQLRMPPIPCRPLDHFSLGPRPTLELEYAKHLLGQGRVAMAREILLRALFRYPKDSRLGDLYRTVSPSRIVPREVTYRDRRLEIAWIKANRSHYRGKWVALLGEQVIGIGDDLKSVLRVVREQQLAEPPLIHHFD